MSRPNVLIFMVDQQRADAIGAFGNDVVQTPNIDALARRGMRFDDAWSQHSVCGPSRVSFMTGWYPHVAGHRTLDNLLEHHEPNLLRTLRDADYKVCMPGNRGDVFAPGVTEASTDMCGFTVAPDPNLMARLSFAYDDDDPMFWTFYFGRQGAEPRLDGDEATIQTAIQWLSEETNDQPWAMWIPLFLPHPPFAVEDPWFSLHDRADVPLPFPRSAGSGKPRFMDAYRAAYGWDRLDEANWREIIATYYGMVSRTDAQLGRVLEAIDRTGQLDNTIVIYLTDHGEYLGDYELVEKWPSGLDPSLVRNPMVIAGPGVQEGAVCTSPVEIIDVLPTLCELADVAPRHTHFGKSLVPLLGDPSAPHRTRSFCEGGFHEADVDLFEGGAWKIYEPKTTLQHEQPRLVGKAHAIRSSEYTYIYRRYESDELYDRVADRAETMNLIDDPAKASIVSAMKAELFEWLVDTSDVIAWDRNPRRPEIPHGPREAQI